MRDLEISRLNLFVPKSDRHLLEIKLILCQTQFRCYEDLWEVKTLGKRAFQEQALIQISTEI